MREFECAPILLIGFNRPDFMAAQIAAVREARPMKLYVAVDGPRANRQGEAEKCRAVRDCVKLVNWPCEVKTLFRENNLGCKLGVSGAISWFFENEEAGIVLEDDCRPTLSFLRFASEMLVRYRDDERVGAIAGFNHFNLQSDSSESYHFSKFFNMWGWASWRRVWRQYDITMFDLMPKLDTILRKSLRTKYYRWALGKGIRETAAGKCNTWDYQFIFQFLANDWLCVTPRVRLVANVGFADSTATHTAGYNYYGRDYLSAEEMRFPLVHPTSIAADEKADYLRERMEGAIFPRGLTWLGCKLPSLSTSLSWLGDFARKIAPILFRL